jgi:hypothetical protein
VSTTFEGAPDPTAVELDSVAGAPASGVPGVSDSASFGLASKSKTVTPMAVFDLGRAERDRVNRKFT